MQRKYIDMMMTFAKLDIVIKSRNVLDANQVKNVTRYMRAKTCIVIGERIEYWIQENIAEIDRKYHNFKSCIKDSEEGVQQNRQERSKIKKYEGNFEKELELVD